MPQRHSWKVAVFFAVVSLARPVWAQTPLDVVIEWNRILQSTVAGTPTPTVFFTRPVRAHEYRGVRCAELDRSRLLPLCRGRGRGADRLARGRDRASRSRCADCALPGPGVTPRHGPCRHPESASCRRRERGGSSGCRSGTSRSRRAGERRVESAGTPICAAGSARLLQDHPAAECDGDLYVTIQTSNRSSFVTTCTFGLRRRPH